MECAGVMEINCAWTETKFYYNGFRKVGDTGGPKVGLLKIRTIK
jgi:hypothetical protein